MYVKEFTEYLQKERGMAANTQEAYRRDIDEFLRFAAARGTSDALEICAADIAAFLMQQRDDGRSASTIHRKLASIRSFFTYLERSGRRRDNPARDIKPPRVRRKELEYLSVAEVERVLAAPDDSTLGVRDRALLELLYATGIRVNEVTAANVEDVNLRIGFFTCPGSSGKARIIPMGRPARAALEQYIYEARPELVPEDEEEEKALFVNYYGRRITRQGLWKILREYGEKAGLEKQLTPHLLRISFAVHMAQNGADLKSLQELLGNEDMTAMQVYLSVTKNRIKDVYDKAHPRA
ncbi:MAG: tyrosine recombinase [Anaerovoracaceae bacterium]|jgi:integrase/recombinase XerD